MKRFWLAVLVALALPGLTQNLDERAYYQFKACQSNLKNLGTALEMYATDFAGHYPPSLAKLRPNYLRTIPSCPAAGKDTYSASYRRKLQPDYYRVACGGHHHQAAFQQPNSPSYDYDRGLVSDPLPAAIQERLDAEVSKDPQRALAACKSNLKYLGTALEMWSVDHQARYPKTLQELVPKYLRGLPTCPSARRDTYSSSYRSDGRNYQMGCQGSNHQAANLGPNRPAYNATQGLIER